MLATELTAWMQMLALTGTAARVWEPKRLRLRLFAIAGRITRRPRRTGFNSPHTPPTGTSSSPAWPDYKDSLKRPEQAEHPTNQHHTNTGQWNPAPPQATQGPPELPSNRRRPRK